MAKLDGRVAVITGDSSGIGLATAKRFVEEGAHVFIMGRRQSEVDKARVQIGKNVSAVQGDVATMKRAENVRRESYARRSALMAAAQMGDRVAYETLLRDCVSFIASIARRQGVPSDRTDDAVQEVLLTVHRARATYDPRRSFDAWLRVIVERRAIDILRQMHRRGAREVHAPLAYEGHADEAVDLSAGIEHKEKVKRIGAALAELPRRQREAVHHLMLGEKSLDDAAVLAGRSRGSLKVNLHRALNALRLKMDRGD